MPLPGDIYCDHCGVLLPLHPSDEVENQKGCPNCNENFRNLQQGPTQVATGTGASGAQILYIMERLIFAGMKGVLQLLSTTLYRIFRTNRSNLHKPPGATLLVIVEFFYSPTTVEKVFRQQIADWRFEYFEALSEKKLWKIRWLRIRYSWAFLKSIGLSKVFSLLSRTIRRSG